MTVVPLPSTLLNRIVAHGEEAPDQLLANPRNFRRHPNAQRDALRGSLRELGWVKSIIVNRTTGHVLDGHARVEEALATGVPTLPVEYVELSEAEEKLALAVLDPITELATRDDEALVALLGEVMVLDGALNDFLITMRPEAPLTPEADAPRDAAAVATFTVSCDACDAARVRRALDDIAGLTVTEHEV